MTDTHALQLANRREQWALSRDENLKKMREYRAANVEKYRRLRREDYARRRVEILAKQRAWRAANPEAAKARDRAKYLANREKKIQYARTWLINNREKNRKRVTAYRRRALGLPEPTRPVPDNCECCGRQSNRSLALDHCHQTGIFRGWLCHGCNTAIGRLGDSIAGLQCAIDYLKRAAGAVA